MLPPLLHLDSAHWPSQLPAPLPTPFHWTVRPGTAWAITGPSGSGKSRFLQWLHRCPTQQTPWIDKPATTTTAFVPFREQSRLFHADHFYYQQRYEFNDADDCPTLEEYLTHRSELTESELTATLERWQLIPQRHLRMIQLSNGQSRRARMAKAVLAKPTLMLLDDPFGGLDTQSRQDLNQHLHRLHHGGLALILACAASHRPDWVADVLALQPNQPAVVSRHLSNVVPVLTAESSHTPVVSSAQPIVAQLRQVRVQHQGRFLLDGIDWTIRQGDRWALLGPNGSGKTTLLSLMCGDHPQVFANDITLFGQRRGVGQTLWQIKQRIGHVSPELHQYFPRMLRAWQAAATGWSLTLTPAKMTDQQEARLRELFRAFQLEPWAKQPWWQLPTGVQRTILFVRAILRQPELLILDEPFQGMDEQQFSIVQRWLEEELQPRQTMILVSHRGEELPQNIGQVLRLQAGQVISTERT